MDTHVPLARRVSHQEFQQALRRASFGLGAGLSFRYDARHDETVWTINGQPVGLTVGRIGATTACYVATSATGTDTAARSQATEPPPPAAAVPDQLAVLDVRDCGRNG
jgi:hypothetical protein